MSITIHTSELVKRYRQRTVVNHVSVQLQQGEIVGLLGPNGAGKTTTFYMVVGLIKPDEGSVFLNDRDITREPMYKRARMGIGYLPQEASIFRKLSVEDNISAVLEMTTLTRREQKAKLESLLEEFRLTHVRKSPGDVLSGGERRRTEIARALAVDPKFILLDEPFAGIDPIAVEDIQGIVARLKLKNIGILITDHNVTETLSICDRAYLLIEGKIFRHGSAEELAADDQVKRLYLGRNFELRRKDYLLEDPESQQLLTSNMIWSVENGIQWIERIRGNRGRPDASPGTGSGEEEGQSKEFRHSIDELRRTLRHYAADTHDEEFRALSGQLDRAETLEALHDCLSRVLQQLRAKENSVDA
ncbi:MAG TPA: LPS export ABC transporter ATP-binding protein [Chitinophagaceae bacterium]|nr:LPS export ABC transporter ATP-binding protein [Chitinophagaceae bacterium]